MFWCLDLSITGSFCSKITSVLWFFSKWVNRLKKSKILSYWNIHVEWFNWYLQKYVNTTNFNYPTHNDYQRYIYSHMFLHQNQLNTMHSIEFQTSLLSFIDFVHQGMIQHFKVITKYIRKLNACVLDLFSSFTL